MKKLVSLTGALAGLVLLSGCQTVEPVQPFGMFPVEPGPYENIIVDHVSVILDASDSMYAPEKYPVARALVQSFVEGMPPNGYDVGVTVFGSEDTDDWLVHQLSPFNRPDTLNFVDGIYHVGGTTPLAHAIRSLEPQLNTVSGTGAIVIFTDGETNYEKTIEAAKSLRETYPGQLCIYAVFLGEDFEGRLLLGDLVNVTGCGRGWLVDKVNSIEGMESMVRTIFFGGYGDEDGDGVPDNIDECPGTPRGAEVDERGCWVLSGVLFATDRYEIRPEYEGLLDDVAGVLRANPNLRIRIEGHTDSRASDGYNQTLSERRAGAVEDALVARGINASRLETRGYGETRPIAPNTTPENMQKNRRVELTPVQ